MKILVDEMYDGLDEKLNELKAGYEAYSVKKLIEKDKKPLRSDYSVITYVKENGMILVTEDKENEKGCKENNIPCVCLNKEQVFKTIVECLKEFKT